MTYDIFISHSSSDKTLALLLKKLFESHFSIFCTSDIKAIEGGKPWFEIIISSLRGSKVCITLLTPNSVNNSWVHFESGGSFILSETKSIKSRMFPVCALGLDKNLIQAPFSHLQAISLNDKSELEELFSEVCTYLKYSSLKPSTTLVTKIISESKKGNKDWRNVQPILAGIRLDSSPFNLDNLLPKAKTQIFVAGQNLYHFSSTDSIKNNLFAWLSKNKKRKAQLLICNPKAKNVNVWDDVGKEFRSDLLHSVKIFKTWLKEARLSKISNRLDIRVTKFVPISLTTIDPEQKTGKLVITPVILKKPHSGSRPHFIINKHSNEIIFNHYWESYKDIFLRSKKLM